MNDYIIRNAKIVLPDTMIEKGSLAIKDGNIHQIIQGESSSVQEDGCKVIDAEGDWIFPGLIDLHNDSIEKEIEPRPNVFFPMDSAMLALESRLLCHGITTVYHSISFTENNAGLRTEKKIMEVIEAITRLRTKYMARHCVHARYDIVAPKYAGILQNMIEQEQVQLISFTDHTPGQGQYKQLSDYKNYMMKHRGYTSEAVDALVEKKIVQSQSAETKQGMDRLAAAATQYGVPMASHDDDSKDKVAFMRQKGVSISEFPLDLETAHFATSNGMDVVVGAPNIVRGKSYSGNMRASDAIENSCASIICSDYHPASVLLSIFTLYRNHGISIWKAVGMASLNPAKAARKDKEIGSLECGKRADILLVSERRGIPEVRIVFVGGKLVLTKGES